MAGKAEVREEMCYDGCGMSRAGLVDAFRNALGLTEEQANARYDELKTRYEGKPDDWKADYQQGLGR